MATTNVQGSKARQAALAEISARIKRLDASESAAAEGLEMSPKAAAKGRRMRVPLASPTTKGAKAPKGKPAATKPAKAPKGAKAAKGGKPAQAPKPARAGKGGGLSGLDAAHKALVKAGAPMKVQEITKAAIELGWAPAGKTPHQTLSAALQREVAAKGKAARFTKAGPGLFAAA